MKTKTQPNKYITYLNKKEDIFSVTKNRVLSKNNGSSILIPHVCNNLNAFGAGFAGAVANTYPIVKENYHLLGPSFLKTNLGYSQYIDVFTDKEYGHKLTFVNMIAQNGLISEKNHRPLNYMYLMKCMLSIKQYISNLDKDTKIEIHCPKFGSGLAGGNWLFINNLIEDIWNNIPVFVY